MTNYFIQIWFLVKSWFKRVRPQVWELVLCLGLFIWGIVVLIYINDIPRIRVDARVGRVSGVGHAEDIKLQFRINSGLLFLRDSVLHSNMAATLRIPYSEQSDESPVADSIRRIFSGKFDNKQALNRLQGVFDMNVHLDFVSRSISRKLYRITTSTQKHILHDDESSCTILWGGQSSPNTMDFRQLEGLFPDAEADLVKDARFSFMYPAFCSFPSFTDLWDISQRSYHLQLDADPRQIEELSFDFLGPIELFPMDPVPDEISMSGFVFTDSVKLRRIREKGLLFHARFPQMENLQDVRIFGLTTFVSLFFTLVCTILFRMVRLQVQAWNKRSHEKRNG